MDKRVERSTQSVFAIRGLLREVIDSPSLFIKDQILVQALKSQGALAKYADQARGISTSSLNTVKRIADVALEGGFDALDRLRQSAGMVLEKQAFEDKSPNKESKAGLSIRLIKREAEIKSLREDLLLLTLAFEKSLRQGNRYATKADESVHALCKREQRELLDILTLRQNSLNTNVKKLRED